MNKYSVCLDAVFMNKMNILEAMKTVKKCGYDSYEFWVWWDKDLDAMEKLQQELKLNCATFCIKFLTNPGNPAMQEQYVEDFKSSIAVARKLSCNTLIAQAGWSMEGISYEEHRASFLQTMKKIAPIAEQEGITVVIEPLNVLVDHPRYHLSTSEDAFRVIDEIGSPNVKILFDLYHQQITEGNLIRNLSENINKIGHFHAAGNPGRNEITKGEIDYRHVFEAIAKTGYEGHIGLEYMTEEDPVPGLTEARRILV